MRGRVPIVVEWILLSASTTIFESSLQSYIHIHIHIYVYICITYSIHIYTLFYIYKSLSLSLYIYIYVYVSFVHSAPGFIQLPRAGGQSFKLSKIALCFHVVLDALSLQDRLGAAGMVEPGSKIIAFWFAKSPLVRHHCFIYAFTPKLETNTKTSERKHFLKNALFEL